jgi:hypothetical protein
VFQLSNWFLCANVLTFNAWFICRAVLTPGDPYMPLPNEEIISKVQKQVSLKITSVFFCLVTATADYCRFFTLQITKQDLIWKYFKRYKISCDHIIYLYSRKLTSIPTHIWFPAGRRIVPICPGIGSHMVQCGENWTIFVSWGSWKWPIQTWPEDAR